MKIYIQVGIIQYMLDEELEMKGIRFFLRLILREIEQN